jgi:uncharacterized repeat protein (TIGR01451 family)
VVDGSSLPLNVLSVHAAQGSCQAGRPTRCRLGTLAAGASTTITIEAVALAAGAQVNTAVATSAGWDPDPSSGLAQARTTVIAVLGLRKSASSGTVAAGQEVTFALRTSNHNGTTLHHVRTCDALPPGLIFVGANPAPKLSLGRYCWTAASLANGKSKTYTIVAQVRLGAVGSAINTATATATGATVTHARATIHITPQAPTACPAAAHAPPDAHAAC